MLKDRKGISPIIGVILVVAMTVLLAVIAWTYLGGLTTSPGKAYMVQADVKHSDPGRITVSFVGKDLNEVYKVQFIGSNNTNGILYWNVSTPTYNTGMSGPTVTNTTFVFNGTDDTNFDVTNADTSDPTNGIVYFDCRLHPTFTFYTMNATEGATNKLKIVVTFRDGTEQTVFDQTI